MMHLTNATVYYNLQSRVPSSMQKEKRRDCRKSTGEMTPVPYPVPAMGATGRLYSGKFRLAPASFSGQP